MCAITKQSWICVAIWRINNLHSCAIYIKTQNPKQYGVVSSKCPDICISYLKVMYNIPVNVLIFVYVNCYLMLTIVLKRMIICNIILMFLLFCFLYSFYIELLHNHRLYVEVGHLISFRMIWYIFFQSLFNDHRQVSRKVTNSR